MSELITVRLKPGSAPPKPEEKAYGPVGVFLDMFRCRDAEVITEGPAGTGKTRAKLEKVHLCLSKYPGARALMTRKTRESLSQTAEVTYTKLVLPEGSGVKYNHDDGEYRYPNGSVLVLAGMDKPGKALSSEYDIIYCNEVTELEKEDYEILTSRNRYGVMPYQQVLGDCNPGTPDHWLYQREGVTWFFARFEDNPRMWHDGDWTEFGSAYVAKLDKLTGYRYRRLRLGERCSTEGMYFEEWDGGVHVIKPFRIPGNWTRWVAIDYGFDKPYAALWLARADEPILTPGGMQRPIYAYDEQYAAGVRAEQQGERIVQRSTGQRIVRYVADRSCWNKDKEHGTNLSIESVYQAAGVKPLFRSNSDRINGWQVVRGALAHDLESGEHPRLYIMSNCKNLIRTIPAMVKDPLDPEDLADKVKGVATEDHAVDALRYGLMAEAKLGTGQQGQRVRQKSAWEEMLES